MSPTVVTNAVLVERLDSISKKMDELGERQTRMDERLKKIEMADVENGIRLQTQVNQACTDVKEHETRLTAIERYMPFIKAMSFVLAGLSIPMLLMLVGFLWALMSGQIEVIVK